MLQIFGGFLWYIWSRHIYIWCIHVAIYELSNEYIVRRGDCSGGGSPVICVRHRVCHTLCHSVPQCATVCHSVPATRRVYYHLANTCKHSNTPLSQPSCNKPPPPRYFSYLVKKIPAFFLIFPDMLCMSMFQKLSWCKLSASNPL